MGSTKIGHYILENKLPPSIKFAKHDFWSQKFFVYPKRNSFWLFFCGFWFYWACFHAIEFPLGFGFIYKSILSKVQTDFQRLKNRWGTRTKCSLFLNLALKKKLIKINFQVSIQTPFFCDFIRHRWIHKICTNLWVEIE